MLWASGSICSANSLIPLDFFTLSIALMVYSLPVFLQVDDLGVSRVDGQGHVCPVGADAPALHLDHVRPQVNTGQALDALRLKRSVVNAGIVASPL
jgi:hypothetical protein